MLININIDCDKCMGCVEVYQNEALTEVFINLVKLILKDNQPDFRKYFHDCTYCESEVYVEGCKIDRYEKKQYKQLELWELKDRLNPARAIVSVYDLPDSIAEEIIDYRLKLIEEKRK